MLTTRAGEVIGVGDRVATRRNDRDLGVANRDTWTVTAVGADGSLAVRGRPGDRTLPSGYAQEHVELAYATTVYGAQGETVDHAHLLISETTGAAAAYVGMTRGREGEHRSPGRRLGRRCAGTVDRGVRPRPCRPRPRPRRPRRRRRHRPLRTTGTT